MRIRHSTDAAPRRAAAVSVFHAVAIACATASAPVGTVLAQPASDALAAGREKFVQCAACHGSDGRSTVVAQYPKIGGQSAPYVVNALKAYRDGRRQGTYAAIMAAVAKPLSDRDIETLAAYIESL